MPGMNNLYRGSSDKEYLKNMRFGRPHSCAAGTSEVMAKKGFFGLYLKSPICIGLSNVRRVPTPPELMEPPKYVSGR
jgi:hypothetical protein